MVTRAAKGSSGVGTRSYTMTVVRTADTLIYIYKHKRRHKRGYADSYINCCFTVFFFSFSSSKVLPLAYRTRANGDIERTGR